MHILANIRSNASIVNQFDCIQALVKGGVNHLTVSVVVPLGIKEVMRLDDCNIIDHESDGAVAIIKVVSVRVPKGDWDSAGHFSGYCNLPLDETSLPVKIKLLSTRTVAGRRIATGFDPAG